MRALVDVTHPAHVHLFRPAVAELRERGHAVRVASREKDVTTDLLDAHGIPHVVLSRKRSGPAGVAREWAGRELRLLRLARRFDPDVILSRLNPASAHVAAALGAPNVVFHDTEVAGALDRVTLPFAAVVATPAEFDRDLPARHLRYEGYHELAYLHPARFSPDAERLRERGVAPEEPYAVLRLVARDGHHDGDDAGLTVESASRFVAEFPGEVFVVSEGDPPDAVAGHEAPVPVEAVHDLLAFADCYLGDSATMATEAGVLGTPAVRYDAFDGALANFDALADYGLVASLGDEREAVDRALELAADPDAPSRWRRRRRRLLAEKIDLTAYVVELAEEVGGE